MSKVITLPLGVIEGVPTIFWADPGTTTGYAIYSPVTGKVVCSQLGPGQHHRELHNLVAELALSVYPEPLVVGYEQFEFRQNLDRYGLVLDSREYIGILKLVTQFSSNIELVSQTASEALWFVKDVKLQALGWYNPTTGLPHARDALRHLLRYLVATRKVREPITTAWFSRQPGLVVKD